MKAIDYLTNLVNWGNVFTPLAMAEQIRNAAMALGYPVCTGALDIENNRVTIYIDR